MSELIDIPKIPKDSVISLSDDDIIVRHKNGSTQSYSRKYYTVPKDTYKSNKENKDTIIYNIIANVTMFCKRNEIGLGEFENELGLSYGYFSRIKHTKNPTLDTLITMANKMDMTIGDLVSTTWNHN